MTIISCQEKGGKRGGKATGTEVTEKITWLVKTTSAQESIYTLLAGLSGIVPDYLGFHPQNPFATLRSYEYEAVDETAVGVGAYLLTGNFSSAPLSQEEEDKSIRNPLDRRARIKWSKVTVPFVVEKDIDGKAVVNAAGDPFDPPIERSSRRWVATVTKNVTEVPAWILDYNDEVVNDAEFEIDGITVQEQCAKLIDLAIGEWQTENGYAFRQIMLAMEFKAAPTGADFRDGASSDSPLPSYTPNGWTLVVLNQGLRERNSTGEDTFEIVAMTDDNGDMLTSPALLNGAGGRNNSPYPDSAVFLCWEQFEAKDFSVLPLS